MTTPVVTFFNNKGASARRRWSITLPGCCANSGFSVVAVDLDPQANLTASFLNDDSVEKLWSRPRRLSVYGALEPLFGGTGGIADPYVEEIAPNLGLVPGDVLLSGTEQELSLAWATSLGGGISAVRAFTVTTAFSALAQRAAAQTDARIVLVDVGPNLGAINRAVMIASDHVVICIPLAPDLYSLQGLRNLGPTLTDWRDDWASHVARKPDPGLEAPAGEMRPRGYVVLQHSTRVDRVVGAYHSLAPMAQEARRPLFLLRSADGGSGHTSAPGPAGRWLLSAWPGRELTGEAARPWHRDALVVPAAHRSNRELP
jgi:cellulose biosynthesis protein BcsQ